MLRYTTLSNALPFISDLKLAHYAKLPPWHTFSAQVVATVISAVVCTAMLNYQINQIPDICQRFDPNPGRCDDTNFQSFTPTALRRIVLPALESIPILVPR